MKRQKLPFKGKARDDSCLHGESLVAMDSCAPRLVRLLPRPTPLAASISSSSAAAAKHKKTTASKNAHQGTVAIPASLQSRRWPFQLCHAPVQTIATISRPAFPTAAPSISPLTIFYNGNVSVYDVPASKAQAIMILAGTPISDRNASFSPTTFRRPSSSTFISMEIPTEPFVGASAQQQSASVEIIGLPVARKQSLQRFIENRKERMNSTNPYTAKSNPVEKASKVRRMWQCASHFPDCET